MADKSKFFRVAVEGATTDGRKIERQHILDMAATYNPATYGARVNMEHIRGFTPEPPFNAYGDVLALKAEEITLELAGKSEKRLALFAQIAPTEDLMRINGAKQKLYTSIEISPNFAGTGKAYLVGLAVTDSPASLGTELLAFAASNAEGAAGVKAALDVRKQDPSNLFTAFAEEVKLELEPNGVLVNPAEITLSGLMAAALAKFAGGGAQAAPTAAPASPQAGTAPALAASTPSPTGQGGDFSAMFAQLLASNQAMAAGFDQIRAADRQAFAQLQATVTDLKTSLDGTQKHTGRPASSGAPAIQQTDC